MSIRKASSRLQPVRPDKIAPTNESHASNNGFEQIVARFQAIEIAGQDQRDPLILADPNAGAIDIYLSTADALPAFINFHHGLDSAS